MLVHMGWVGSEPPDRVLSAVEAARRAAVGCDVVFHADESDVPDRWKPESYGYSLIPHIRSDIQRHAVLMKYGGLWLDADVRLISSPAVWAAGWTDYTAVRLHDRAPLIGTDIIFAESNWSGWSHVESYITAIVSSRPRRLSVLSFAHEMIADCIKSSGAIVNVAEPGAKFPYDQRRFSRESVVARGFDPPEIALGLGDMIASSLDAIGITKERVQALASTVGIKDCGCAGRHRLANELGAKYLGLPPGSSIDSR